MAKQSTSAEQMDRPSPSSRVVIQDDKHTVWCTAHGQVYRSAPEKRKSSFPKKAKLPEDMTPLMQ